MNKKVAATAFAILAAALYAINIPFSSSEVSFFELDNIDSLSKAVDSALKNKLSNNEKLMILSHQEDPDISLDNSEIELIN